MSGTDPVDVSHAGVMVEEPAATEKPKRGRPKGAIVKRKLRAPVRAETGSAVREPVRVRLRDPEGGRFEIPDRIKAMMPDRTLEWKTHTVVGAHDPYYAMEMKRKGWEPVTSRQLPGLMPPGHSGAIIRDGLILMERPKELTAEARADEQAARNEMANAKIRQLADAGPNEGPRDHPDVRPRVRQTYAPISG